MATAAAIMNTPAARPTAGDNRVAQADRDRDDSFSRMVDAARDDRDDAIEAETAEPAPAPVAETPAKLDHAEAASEAAAEKDASEKASAAKAFQAALNQINADDAASAADADADSATAVAQGDAEAAADGAKPAASTAAATTAATQANAALLALANATGAGPANGTQAADADASNEAKTADGSEIAALLGITQPITSQAVTPATQATGEGDVAIQSAAAKPGIAEPAPGEVAGQTLGNAETGKDSKPADATTQSAASSQAKAQSPSQAAMQATTTAPADAAVKVAIDVTAPAPQAATQPSTTSNPLSDASRASATPPALQSAPAATIEVYSRIIERADGRAQRFEVRLDPVELGRVDVRIEIGADKKVHAVLAAHDSAALSDLMRGQRALERALSDAGIDLADNGVRFEMSNDAGRGGASQQREGDTGGRSSPSDVWRNFDTALIPVSAETAAAVTPSWRPQRLDLVA